MTPKVYILTSLRHAAVGLRQVARRTNMKRSQESICAMIARPEIKNHTCRQQPHLSS